MVISGGELFSLCVCLGGLSLCLCARALKGKRLELSTPNLVRLYAMAVARHAWTQRSKGQKVKVAKTVTVAYNTPFFFENRNCQTLLEPTQKFGGPVSSGLHGNCADARYRQFPSSSLVKCRYATHSRLSASLSIIAGHMATDRRCPWGLIRPNTPTLLSPHYIDAMSVI